MKRNLGRQKHVASAWAMLLREAYQPQPQMGASSLHGFVKPRIQIFADKIYEKCGLTTD